MGVMALDPDSCHVGGLICVRFMTPWRSMPYMVGLASFFVFIPMCLTISEVVTGLPASLMKSTILRCKLAAMIEQSMRIGIFNLG
jgi:hypothetical protein